MVQSIRFKKPVIAALVCFLFLPSLLSAGKDLEISKDFTLFTSKNLQGYLKPLFTTIGESFNAHYYTKAQYDDFWNIGLDISINGAFIPNSQKMYNAELPVAYGNTDVIDNAMLKSGTLSRQIGGTTEEPTIFGGNSFAVFSAPQVPKRSTYSDSRGPIPDSSFKSVAFAEGNNLDFVAGVPAVQLVLGIPTRTEFRFRFWGAPVQDESMIYFGIIVNQQVDHFFNLFGQDSTLGLALNLGYHSLNRDKGVSITSYSVGAHFSKSWDNGFSAFVGAQYEGLSGKFEAVRENNNPDDVANSPYIEVREGRPLAFDIESFNSYRILGGISYRASFAELHADVAWAEQPMVTFGITFWIANFGKKEKVETIERYEEIERIERIKKKEVKQN